MFNGLGIRIQFMAKIQTFLFFTAPDQLWVPHPPAQSILWTFSPGIKHLSQVHRLRMHYLYSPIQLHGTVTYFLASEIIFSCRRILKWIHIQSHELIQSIQNCIRVSVWLQYHKINAGCNKKYGYIWPST